MSPQQINLAPLDASLERFHNEHSRNAAASIIDRLLQALRAEGDHARVLQGADAFLQHCERLGYHEDPQSEGKQDLSQLLRALSESMQRVRAVLDTTTVVHGDVTGVMRDTSQAPASPAK